MICLGIESTAHTFGIGIVTDTCEILANEKEMFKPGRGGILPREAAEHHSERCNEILDKALKKAGITVYDIDLIAFSQGPGLPPCLKIGAVFARALKQKTGKPLVGVNHCVAHLEIGKAITKAKEPTLLYVSGANTQVIAFENKKYRVFGETLDMGVGNFLDTFGREKGITFPAGPEIEKLSNKGKYVSIPYSVKGMDISLSGILTHCLRINRKIEDLCYSIQETVFAMLIEVTERAMAHTNKTELILGGGVAANKRLNDMAEKMCNERKAKFYKVPADVCVDNGVMIAWNGILQYKSQGETSDTRINKSYRTDMVGVTWK